MAIERGWERSGKTANQISKNFYGMTIMGFQHTLGNKKSQFFGIVYKYVKTMFRRTHVPGVTARPFLVNISVGEKKICQEVNISTIQAQVTSYLSQSTKTFNSK